MKTLKLRVKDKHAKVLNQMARDVNFVWNYCNELSYKHLQRTGKFFSAWDMYKYLAGATKEGLVIRSHSMQAVADEYVVRRRQFKKSKLAWRKSMGSRRSLGWIPFKVGNVKFENGNIKYNGGFFSIWDSYGLHQYKLRSGSFNQDSLGRWYINIVVETLATNKPKSIPSGRIAVGIDLGLKDFAVLSNGTKITAPRIYRQYEAKLGISQRANNKARVRAINAKIANIRKDFQHKLSRQLVNDHAAIFVGNINAKGLAKTRLAKSVLDAGWSAFRTMLMYKSHQAGVWFIEVNEAYTTQMCSCCQGITDNSPKGRAGLGIREWACMDCGTVHDRDINAAMNILALGHQRLAEGITT